MNTCKNNHPIENKEGNLIILCNCVMHCHKCGNTATFEKVTALYLNDDYKDNETYHIFYLYPNLFCESCGNMHNTFAVRCYSHEEAVENYKAYRGVSSTRKGLVQ